MAAAAGQTEVLVLGHGAAGGEEVYSGADDLDAIGRRNPFALPPGDEIFHHHAREKAQLQAERKRRASLKVHEKLPLKATQARRRRIASGTGVDTTLPAGRSTGRRKRESKSHELQKAADELAVTTRDRRLEKEDLNDYVAKKRQLFLLQYSLDTKREEMAKLHATAAEEEGRINTAEALLESNATKFDQFLKENDRMSVAAIRAAEAQTREKLEKVAEIKALNADVLAVRSELSRQTETIERYAILRTFLERLTPEEWLAERRAAVTSSAATRPVGGSSSAKQRARSRLNPDPVPEPATPAAPEAEADSAAALFDPSEVPELYFTSPDEVLKIFAELEAQNLQQIQHGQETEEALQDLQERVTIEQAALREDNEALQSKIQRLEDEIRKEEATASDLKVKCQFFAAGNAAEEDKAIAELHSKVEEVYVACIGDNEASIGALEMLTQIENSLEELFERLERMPPEHVEAARKAKDKERRRRAREHKAEEQRRQQAERLRRAEERSRAAPKRRTGKPVMFRSVLPTKARPKARMASKTAVQEEHEYFFT